MRRYIQQDVEVPWHPKQEGHHERFGAVLLTKVRFETIDFETGEEPPCQQNREGDNHCTVSVLVDLPSDGRKVRCHGSVVDAWPLNAVGEGVHEGGEKGDQVR